MIRIVILAKGETAKARDNARGHLFELMSADLFRRLGHTIDEINASQSGGEIDIVCHSVLGGVPCVSECKAHNRPVSVGDLKKFKSTYEDHRRRDPATIGIMISLGGFGPDALEYFRREIEPNYPHFEILDADRIYELLVASNLIATYQEVRSLVAARTDLFCADPILLYAQSQFFWIIEARMSGEQTFTRFVITDLKGMLLRDPVLLKEITQFAIQDLGFQTLCVNEAFPEPFHRVMLTEAGRYFGLRGQYQFPSQKCLRDVLENKNPHVCQLLNDFLSSINSHLANLTDATVWRIHCEETERILNATIPDEIKEDLFPIEIALIISGAWAHHIEDLAVFNPQADSKMNSQELKSYQNAIPPQLSRHLQEVINRIHNPFSRTGRPTIEGHEKVHLDFITATLKLACSLDLAFFRAPALVYRTVERHHPILEETFESFQANGLLLDYNEHRVTVDVTCYTPEAHLAILRLADWVQSTLDDIEPVLYERGIRFLRIDARVDGRGYEMVGCRFEAHTESVVKLLMGRALYGTEDVAIRELVQNAMDAVFTQSLVSLEDYHPSVSVYLVNRGDVRYLEVEDNGCGMDRYIVQRYFSAIGKSFWRSEDFRSLTGSQPRVSSSLPIGQFGIGILSSFMIGDNMEIDTKMEYSPGVYISIPGVRDYFIVRTSDRRERGTKVRLRLTSKINVKKTVEKYVVRPHSPIEIVDQRSRTHKIGLDSTRIWKRLKAPKELSGRSQYFGFPVSVKGDGFEGQIMVILPGDKAQIPERPQSSRWYNYDNKGWKLPKSYFLLLQSGILVKETIQREEDWDDIEDEEWYLDNDSQYDDDEDDWYGSHDGDVYSQERELYDSKPRNTGSIKPKWIRGSFGFLDCLPGVLELAVSRNDIVGEGLPEQCLKAIDAAKLEALTHLESRCGEIWKSTSSPTSQQRKLINTTLTLFNPSSYQENQSWHDLIVSKYSLRGFQMQNGQRLQLFRTAAEIKRDFLSISSLIFSISEGKLKEWQDVLALQGTGSTIYIVDPGEIAMPALETLGCKRLEGEQWILEKINIEEEQGELQKIVPGYCGFCWFRRPAFSGFVIGWFPDRNWCVTRAEAADVNRSDFLKDETIREKIRSKKPKIMFNSEHPLSDLIRRILAYKHSDSMKEQVEHLLMTAIRLLEARGERQKKALFKEFTKQLKGALDSAKNIGILKPSEKGLEVNDSEFVVRSSYRQPMSVLAFNESDID